MTPDTTEFVLGLDTGGTYTDAVIARSDGELICSAKALTTPLDLTVGITGALSAVLGCDKAPSPDRIGLVGLSTTLATNAIVEGRGRPVGLVLIGYDRDLIARHKMTDRLAAEEVAYIGGGHDYHGTETAPLDEAALAEAVGQWGDRVEAVGVSSFFGVRNPDHELRAAALIADKTGLPVTMGHQLTSRLDSIRRATTVALNARLTPLLSSLIATVKSALGRQGVPGRLMVVKGDGSLVDADWAALRPVETILSGPAASLIGAHKLAGAKADQTMWVVDMGGTTTDIVALENGLPTVNPEGAEVGGWRTMVEALDVRTIGLGGDSRVAVDRRGDLTVGPRRVVPICQLAAQYPQVTGVLRAQVHLPAKSSLAGRFALAGNGHPANGSDRQVADRVASAPASLLDLSQGGDGLPGFVVEAAIGRGEVREAGFTPTDALHALGRMDDWDGQASLAAAGVLARQVDLTVDEFLARVVELVSRRAAAELISKALDDDGCSPDWSAQPLAQNLLDRALGGAASRLTCRLNLDRPVAAIGAPVSAYFPRAAELIGAELIVPQHAEVANALGAVAGGVVARRTVKISLLGPSGPYRVHLPDQLAEHGQLEAAVDAARGYMADWFKARMACLGAAGYVLDYSREDLTSATGAGSDDTVYLGSELRFVATGRPGPV